MNTSPSVALAAFRRAVVAKPEPALGLFAIGVAIALPSEQHGSQALRDSGVNVAIEDGSSGGNLGNGRTRTAMYTDCIEQLRGTAGVRQVKVRAETALGAFTTPSSGGWIMFGKHPS